jgi:hypothetical protein
MRHSDRPNGPHLTHFPALFGLSDAFRMKPNEPDLEDRLRPFRIAGAGRDLGCENPRHEYLDRTEGRCVNSPFTSHAFRFISMPFVALRRRLSIERKRNSKMNHDHGRQTCTWTVPERLAVFQNLVIGVHFFLIHAGSMKPEIAIEQSLNNPF